MSSTTSTANPTASQPDTRLELSDLLYRAYYVTSIIFCVAALSLSQTKGGIWTILEVPIVLISCLLMSHIMRTEPSHVFFHFLLYLVAISHVIYTYVSLKDIFENLTNDSNPTLAVVIAVSAGVATLALLEAFFFGVFSFRHKDLGWYGSFHKKLWEVCTEVCTESGNGIGFFVRALLRLIATCVLEKVGVTESDEQAANTASDRQPLITVEMEDEARHAESEATYLPPYSYHKDTTHDGCLYRKIEDV